MSWRPSHEWVEGACLPALAAGVVIIACRLSTCGHCHTLRVVDEGTGEVTYLRRASREEDRVLSVLPACLAPPPFMRPVGAPPALNAAVRAVLSGAEVAPVEPAPAPQLGLW